MHRKKILAILVAVVGLPAFAQATLIDITSGNVRLSQVIGNEFIVGDKKFKFADDCWDGNGFSAYNIKISPLIFQNPLDGQGFRLTGDWRDGQSGGDSGGVEDGNGVRSWNIRYSVEVLPQFIAQGYRISDTYLAFDGDAYGNNSYAKVNEAVKDAYNNLISNRSVYANGNGTEDLVDQFDLPNLVTKLNIYKELKVYGYGQHGWADATTVDQAFSQTVIIPLPSAAGLGLAGMLGLAARRRR
jgi:hypothetical protein